MIITKDEMDTFKIVTNKLYDIATGRDIVYCPNCVYSKEIKLGNGCGFFLCDENHGLRGELGITDFCSKGRRC